MEHKQLSHPIILLSFFFGFCFFYINALPVFNDFDTAWHIRAGDLIRQLGHLPESDSWAYTTQGQIWYNISWLWDVALSYIVEYLGLSSLYYFNALFYGSIAAAVSYCLVVNNINLASIAVTVLLVTLCLFHYACLRPFSFSFLMLPIFMAQLRLFVNKGNYRHLALLPLLMILWVNIHGAFIAGFVVIGSFGLEMMLQKDWKKFIALVITGFISLLVLTINPYGIAIYAGVTSTTASNFTGFIDEWQRYKFGSEPFIALYTIFLAALSNSREKTIALADKLLAIFWFFMGLLYVRNIPIFVLCSAPYFAANLKLSGITRKMPDINILSSIKLTRWLVISITTLLLLIPHHKDFLNTEQRLPINAVAFIEQNYPKVRFLNDYGLGSYLIFLTKGSLPIYVDGRAGTAYNEEVLQDYLLLTSGMSLVLPYLLEKYEITGVITYRNRPLNGIFAQQKGWQQVYFDNNFVIYIKN